MLVTDDPALMRRMNTVRSLYRRSDWYVGLRFDPNRDNVLSQIDEEKHTDLRTKMAVGVSSHWPISLCRRLTLFIVLRQRKRKPRAKYRSKCASFDQAHRLKIPFHRHRI